MQKELYLKVIQTLLEMFRVECTVLSLLLVECPPNHLQGLSVKKLNLYIEICCSNTCITRDPDLKSALPISNLSIQQYSTRIPTKTLNCTISVDALVNSTSKPIFWKLYIFLHFVSYANMFQIFYPTNIMPEWLYLKNDLAKLPLYKYI